MLRRNYPEAEVLYQTLRPIKAAADIDAALIAQGILSPARLAA
jgi:tRNA-dihydrouridine synthase C